MEAKLKQHLELILAELGLNDISVLLEHPADVSHGDWATNVAMAGAKKAGKNPREFAEEIVAKLKAIHDPDIAAIGIAGPGFINFTLSKDHFAQALDEALGKGEQFGTNDTLKGKKVIVEYTDPNPFKEFHIGHLMSNTVGESIARIVEASGAETKRACYQGDVGMHVAAAVWGMEREALPKADASVIERAAYLGRAYARGASSAKFDDVVKHEIVLLNKKIYDRTDENVNRLYDIGKAWSLAYFEEIYKKLGTKFDHYFFESQTGVYGKELALAHVGPIFEKSDGAVVYKGDESKGLHTRVFINKEGLPTYEAKELGLAKIKYDTYPYDISIIITGNEVNDYFRVLLDAMSRVFPDLAAKTEHYSHGMLRLPTGKMSSRTGDVITAESLILDIKAKALVKIAGSEFSDAEKNEIAAHVAVGAIKYSILRQASGKDIVFDAEQSLSFEGDSGPYLQYTHARTCSLLAKAGDKKIDVSAMPDTEALPLHKHILRFPEIVLRAQAEREPHYIATYLIELAREFNGFYGNTIVLDGAPDEPYKLALVQMTSRILRRGLLLLGIPSPTKM